MRKVQQKPDYGKWLVTTPNHDEKTIIRPTKDMNEKITTREQMLALLEGDDAMRAFLGKTVQAVLEGSFGWLGEANAPRSTRLSQWSLSAALGDAGRHARTASAAGLPRVV